MGLSGVCHSQRPLQIWRGILLPLRGGEPNINHSSEMTCGVISMDSDVQNDESHQSTDWNWKGFIVTYLIIIRDSKRVKETNSNSSTIC